MTILGSFRYYEVRGRCHTWEYHENNEFSRLYIHQWAVPEPPPKVIQVTIRFADEYKDENIRSKSDYDRDPQLLNRPIIIYVDWTDDKTKTIKFDAQKYRDEEPLTSIYVPRSFLEGNENVRTLQIEVNWDGRV